MSALVVLNIGTTSIDWKIIGLSSNWNRLNYDYATIGNAPVPINGGTISPHAYDVSYPPPTGTNSETQTSNIGGIFTPGGTYTAYGHVATSDGRWWDAGSRVFTMQNPRPSTFNWDPDKTKITGGNFVIGAGEWTRLQNNIDAMRYYKNGSPPFGFTSVYTGNNYEAFLYRQCVNAISGMSPPTSVPPLRYTDDEIKADDINRLRLSINSIS